MSVPFVTIAIPVYNAGRYLEDSIQSVLNQTFTDFELLLLNDGSTDNSVDIMQSFSDSRIKIINDGENKGLVFRLNQSIVIAQGKYYSRMDADDIMHPERIAKQIDYLENNPNIDLIGSACYLIDVDNNITSLLQLPATPLQNDIICNRAFLHPSVTGRSSWFLNNHYDDRFVRIEDKELWLRTSPFTKWCNLPEPLMFYRVMGGSGLAKYLKTQRYNFYLMYSYRNRISFSTFVRECVKTAAKILIYTLLVYCHMDHFLMRQRCRHNTNFGDGSTSIREVMSRAIAKKSQHS